MVCAPRKTSSSSTGREWPRGGCGRPCGCSTTASPASGSTVAEGHPPGHRRAGRCPRPRRADRVPLRHSAALRAKECFPGIARVLVQLEHDRERLQRRVVKAIDRLEAEGVLREMRRAGKRILRQVQTLPEDARTPEALARIRRHILRRLDELAPAPGQPGEPGRPERHHAMRIAAKRLRYTLEICRPCIRRGSTSPWTRSSGCRRSWAKSTIATFGWNISTASPPPSASASRPCLATPAGSSTCSPASSISGRTARPSPTGVWGLVEYWAELGRAADSGTS